jgi:uncharacterized repeat protein (TIGR03803 family)
MKARYSIFRDSEINETYAEWSEPVSGWELHPLKTSTFSRRTFSSTTITRHYQKAANLRHWGSFKDPGVRAAIFYTLTGRQSPKIIFRKLGHLCPFFCCLESYFRPGFLLKHLGLTEKKTMATRMPDVLKTNWNGARRLAIACAVLVVIAGARLHAQSYQVLYNFNCASGGCTPEGALVQGKDGNLYGTTSAGGSNNLGTIFVVSTAGTGYTVLWNFDSSTGAPTGGLTVSSVDGNFYGTTGSTLYRFVLSTLTLTVLHTFSNTEGIPQGPPVEDTHKNLYGVNDLGSSPGTAYRFTVATDTYELLTGKVPVFPSGPLFLASDGHLYGATSFGGKDEAGTIFSITSKGGIKTVYYFTGEDDGTSPNAPLVEGKDGNLYGTAYSGGFANFGTIFNLTLPKPMMPSVETPLHYFDRSGTDPYNPGAGLLAASDGNFYGSTTEGGADNLGSLFEWQPGGGGSFLELFDLSGTTGTTAGANPNSNMIEDTNGVFYGVTPAGGSNGSGNGDGVLFSLTPLNLLSHISLCCNWWVILDQPVTVIGQNLTGVISVEFGTVAARFRPGSNTYLTAYVPSAAIDSPVTVTLATGLQLQTQQNARILPRITNLDPSSGPVGTQVGIVGGGFAGTTQVTFGGVATGNFTVVSPALIQATVPSGAQTGKVVVKTPNGSATSKQTFTVN